MIKIGISPDNRHFVFQWKHQWHYPMRAESQQPSTYLSTEPSLAFSFCFVSQDGNKSEGQKVHKMWEVLKYHW